MSFKTSALRSAAVLAAAALVLTGCSSSDEDTTAEDTASVATSAPAESEATEAAAEVEFPLTFENVDGTTTEIPEQPQNVVSTSVTLTGALLTLDAPVTASASGGDGLFFAQWEDQATDIENLWSAGTVDLDALIAADPDLIVVATEGRDAATDNIADFQAIAPTIVVDYSQTSWQDLTMQLGEATGLVANAEAAIQEVEDRTAEVAANITVPEGQANIVSYTGPGEANQIAKVGGPHAEFLEDLGFTIEDPNPEWHTQANERSDFVWAPYENLSQLTADTTFILSADNEGAQAFAEDPVLANVPSVVNGQVYGLGPNSFRIDYYSALEILDGIEQNFAN